MGGDAAAGLYLMYGGGEGSSHCKCFLPCPLLYIKPTKSILPRVKRGHAYGVPFALLVSLSQVKSISGRYHTAVLLSPKSICTLHALEVQ